MQSQHDGSSQEKSYYQMRCDFYEKFKNEIAPKLRYYEETRKKEKSKTFLVTFISIILAIIFLFVFAPLAGLFIIIAIVGNVFIRKFFENKIKYLIMPLVCSCYGNLKWYCANPVSAFNMLFSKDKNREFEFNVDAELIAKSLIVPNYNSASYDDIFTGSHNDVPFEIVEACYTKESGSGKDRHSVTVFDGVIIKFKMNKDFKGHTVVRPDSVFHLSPSSRLKHTELEDVGFEKKFDVFTDDEIEARYLLTTSFMDRLTKLKAAFFAQKTGCAFYNGYLFVALYTPKDLFSLASLDKPLDDFRQYEVFHNEIISIIRLIDHFKLDEKTGL